MFFYHSNLYDNYQLYDFNSSMEYIENAGYPEKPKDRHGRRTSWLLKKSGILNKLKNIPHVIVAGSCGKGSTARFLAFIVSEFFSLTNVKKPVGLGTKPPLFQDNEGNRERYQLIYPGEGKSRWISQGDLSLSVSSLRPLVEHYKFHKFYIDQMASYDLRMAVLADYFVKKDVGFGIFEANIGLREDPASALANPEAIVLNTIGKDHLGQLLPPSILPSYLKKAGEAAGPVYHKAGGLKKDIPAVIGYQKDNIMEAILEIAEEKGAFPVNSYGSDFSINSLYSDILGSKANISVNGYTLDVELSIPGKFHIKNAVLAAYTASLLWHRGVLKGTSSELIEAIKRGLRKTDTPGRMQVIRRTPVTIVSAGASSLKFEATMDAIEDLMKNSGKKNIILGATFMTRVENPEVSIVPLLKSPGVKYFLPSFCFEKENSSEQADPLKIIKYCKKIRPDVTCKYFGDPLVTYNNALEIADPKKDIILLVGTAMVGTLFKNLSFYEPENEKPYIPINTGQDKKLINYLDSKRKTKSEVAA